jgi:hypothetical protein
MDGYLGRGTISRRADFIFAYVSAAPRPDEAVTAVNPFRS